MYRFGKHLRNKILVVLFMVGLVPLLILGLISLASINSLHRLDVASIEQNLISQKTEEIRSFMSGIVSTFQLIVPFEQVSDIELSQQVLILQQLLDEFVSLEEASFISLSGIETSKVVRQRTVGSGEAELQSQSNIEKFKVAMSGKNYVSPAYFTIKGPMVTVSSPVFNRNGVTISILTGEVNLSQLRQIIEKSRLGDEGYVYVVDSDGFVIVSSQPAKNTLKSLKSINYVEGLIKNGNGSGLSNRYLSIWGENVIAEGVYLSDLGIAIISEWPVNDAEKVVITVRNQVILFLLIVLISTLIASVLFAGRIVRPIKILEHGTKQIAEGKFDVPVDIRTGDEIEELGVAFNSMTKGLKHLEELKNEFIFIAAHELKTPVAVIRGYLALILDGSLGPVSDRVQEVNLKIANANQRLIQLVNDLLQIGRADAGRLEIKVSAIDIREPIESVISELKLLAGEKNITVVYEAQDNLPKIMSDGNRLKEIMSNLISNAIKYNIDGGKVSISHTIDGNSLITRIKDTGLGMSKKDREKLFEKFYRIQTDNTKNIPGTGLGLFIVRQIIDKMGGKIWVESTEGTGSTFSFSLGIAD